MVAIPIDTKKSTVLSELYGKAPYFAILDMEVGYFNVVKNEEIGKGPKSAEFLKKHGVNSTIYYHMGEGVYKSFEKNSMSVYTSKHNHYTIDEIYHLMLDKKLTQVNSSNSHELLDPGESGSCKCGCNE